MNKTLADGNVAEAAVEIVTYDDEWPAMFEAERSLLQEVLSVWLTGEIEHIGSTAVPGLMAKPVIDIMAPVAELTTSLEAIEALKNLGYVYHPYKSEVMHWFCKPSPHFRTHHLHLVPRDSSLWKERLIFRDALRQDEKLSSEYAALKLDLSHLFRLDREAYTTAKKPFIARVLLQFSGSDLKE